MLDGSDMRLKSVVYIFVLEILFSLIPVRLEISRARAYLSYQQVAVDDYQGLITDFCISTW